MTYRDFRLYEIESGDIIARLPSGRIFTAIPFKSVDDAKKAIDAFYEARQQNRFTWTRWPP